LFLKRLVGLNIASGNDERTEKNDERMKTRCAFKHGVI
jgi:hypothetical protein